MSEPKRKRAKPGVLILSIAGTLDELKVVAGVGLAIRWRGGPNDGKVIHTASFVMPVAGYVGIAVASGLQQAANWLRANKLGGKHLLIELCNERQTIIFNEEAEIAFGQGVLADVGRGFMYSMEYISGKTNRKAVILAEKALTEAETTKERK